MDLNDLLESALDDFTELGISHPAATEPSTPLQNRAALLPQSDRPAPQTPLSATLDQLGQQTQEMVANMDVVDEDNILGYQLADNMMKQLEEMVGSEDVQSVMDAMMGELLSKEMLHEPMKDLGDRYREWLPANKSQLSHEDYSRFSRQYQYILQLCDVWETTPSDDQKAIELLQQMQSCGQPPTSILRELAPGLELDQEGLPMLPDFLTTGSGGDPNCTIM